MIQKLKPNIFEIDLLIAIEGDARLGTYIRTLLDKLNQRRVSCSMIQFLFDFKVYFDQVYRDIDLKITNSAQNRKKRLCL